jgi:hypothetical protein
MVQGVCEFLPAGRQETPHPALKQGFIMNTKVNFIYTPLSFYPGHFSKLGVGSNSA